MRREEEEGTQEHNQYINQRRQNATRHEKQNEIKTEFERIRGRKGQMEIIGVNTHIRIHREQRKKEV